MCVRGKGETYHHTVAMPNRCCRPPLRDRHTQWCLGRRGELRGGEERGENVRPPSERATNRQRRGLRGQSINLARTWKADHPMGAQGCRRQSQREHTHTHKGKKRAHTQRGREKKDRDTHTRGEEGGCGAPCKGIDTFKEALTTPATRAHTRTAAGEHHTHTRVRWQSEGWAPHSGGCGGNKCSSGIARTVIS